VARTTTDAAIEYIRRKTGKSRPVGHSDKGGRWDASSTETASCCLSIRSPSRSFPYSRYKHCLSLLHLCTLYGVHPKEVRELLTIKKLPTMMGKHPDMDTYIKSRFEKGK
jgi:hypothetical protein